MVFVYVDQQEGDWDPNNLKALYNTVDKQISSTLDVVAASTGPSAELDRELEGGANVFGSYWKPKRSTISYHRCWTPRYLKHVPTKTD